MKLSKIFVLVLVFFSFFSQVSSYECASTPNNETVQKVVGKLQSIAKKHHIQNQVLAKKVKKLLAIYELSATQKCLLYTAVEQFETNTPEKTTHTQVEKLSLLYPSYRKNYIPKIKKEVLESFIFQKQNTTNTVYLTFDDGPGKSLPGELKKKNIAATFFFTCNAMNQNNIVPYTDKLFSIGVHTNTHSNYDNLTLTQINTDIQTCKNKFQKLGVPWRIFRPAYGIINERSQQVLKKYNLDAYIWTIDSLDWNKNFTDARITKIVKNIKQGDIVLFHENVDREKLFILIEKLQKKGFNFGKL